LEAVFYDLRQKRITVLVPKPAFLPLFQEVNVLKEEEASRFRVLPAARESQEETEKG
jgi:hypothetical protein